MSKQVIAKIDKVLASLTKAATDAGKLLTEVSEGGFEAGTDPVAEAALVAHSLRRHKAYLEDQERYQGKDLETIVKEKLEEKEKAIKALQEEASNRLADLTTAPTPEEIPGEPEAESPGDNFGDPGSHGEPTGDGPGNPGSQNEPTGDEETPEDDSDAPEEPDSDEPEPDQEEDKQPEV